MSVASRTCACSAVLAVLLGGCVGTVSPPAAPPGSSPAPGGGAAAPAQTAPSAAAPAGQTRYRCDHDITFTVQFADGAAEIDAGPQGRETLLRDAGGLTPQQTVYSSTSLKAEFGLGPDGQLAVLHYASPPLQAHCRRD